MFEVSITSSRLCARPARQACEQAIAALGAVGIEADEFRDRRVRLARRDGGGDVGRRLRARAARARSRRPARDVAPAHARRAHDPDIDRRAGSSRSASKLHRAGEFAAEAVADPHSQRRRRCLAVHDDVEMGIERGDLVDLDEGEPHLLGQRRQMARVQAAEMVLQQMQVLDQQIAPPLAVAEQCLHLGERRRIDLPSLRLIGPAPAPRARMDATVVFWGRRHQRFRPLLPCA